jgi:hypothetical protein
MKAQYIEINKSGSKYYYSNREMTVRHREDGPAVEYSNGDKSWWYNGKRHREDGPATQWLSGQCWWYLNGESMLEAEHARRTAKETVLTLEEIAAKFGITVEQLKIKK